MSTKLPTASTSIDGILLNTAQTINGDKQVNVSTGSSWVFDKAFTGAVASNVAAVFQRSGGAVAISIGYSDVATNMYLGTSTNHTMDFRTNNTKVGQISNLGFWQFGSAQTLATFHDMFGGLNVSGKLSSSGTYSLGSSSTAADDTERLAYFLANTFLTSGTPRFQYMGNKAGSGLHGWGVDASGNMIIGKGTASTGFIDQVIYATASTAGAWTFGPNTGNVTHVMTGKDSASTGINNSTLMLRSASTGGRIEFSISTDFTNVYTIFDSSTGSGGAGFRFTTGQSLAAANRVGEITSAGAWTLGAGTTTPIHSMNTTTSTTAAVGGTTPPVTVAGYIHMNINGTLRKVPYYA